MSGKKELKDKGFTLVEMIIVLAIFTILLGILIPSLNALIGYRVDRAAKSIDTGIERMRTEAMSRLVAEMKLEKKKDGYYISYCLYKGKQSGMAWSDEEKIAPAKTTIMYQLDEYYMKEPKTLEQGDSLILTVDRRTGGFRSLQSKAVTTQEVEKLLENNQDITYHDIKNADCYKIIVSGRFKKKIISLEQSTGQCMITSG